MLFSRCKPIVPFKLKHDSQQQLAWLWHCKPSWKYVTIRTSRRCRSCFELTEKVKQSLYRSGQALRVPGGIGFQNFQTIGTFRWEDCQPYAPAAFTSQEIFLVLSSVRGWVNHRTTVWPEGLCQSKIPVTPSGMEPATLPFVTRCLNQLRHGVPPVSQVLFWIVTNTVILLTRIGTRPVEELYILPGQILTTIYFLHYIVNPIITNCSTIPTRPTDSQLRRTTRTNCHIRKVKVKFRCGAFIQHWNLIGLSYSWPQRSSFIHLYKHCTPSGDNNLS
jgi:hypothetical protein